MKPLNELHEKPLHRPQAVTNQHIGFSIRKRNAAIELR